MWTPPFTSTGPICLRRVARHIPRGYGPSPSPSLQINAICELGLVRRLAVQTAAHCFYCRSICLCHSVISVSQSQRNRSPHPFKCTCHRLRTSLTDETDNLRFVPFEKHAHRRLKSQLTKISTAMILSHQVPSKFLGPISSNFGRGWRTFINLQGRFESR